MKNYIIVPPDELNHYGVKGMKWGVRKDPRSDGLRGVKAIRANRIERKANRSIAKMTKKRDAFLSERRKNQAKAAAKYNKKIQKAQAKGDDYKVSILTSKKAHNQNVWSSASKEYKKGYDYYNKVTADYAKTRVKALNDKSYKKTDAYKLAGKRYVYQKNSGHSKELTALGFSDYKERGRVDKAYNTKKQIKQAKERRNKAWDKAETANENRQIAINKKYGQHGNNFEGKNQKLSRMDKKAYNRESKLNWDTYENDYQSARETYKKEKKAIKKANR